MIAVLQSRVGASALQLNYQDLIFKRVLLQDVVQELSIVRVDSMLESIELRHAVMELGREDAEAEGAPVATRQEMTFEREQGNFSHPLWGRQMYWGMNRLLDFLHEGCNPKATWVSQPPEIAILFDKYRCQQVLHGLQIPIPNIHARPESYAELREVAKTHPRLILKTSHGSGGAGCIALHADRGRMRGFTALQHLQKGSMEWLYCGRSIRTVNDEQELARIVDRLCQEKCHVETWLPKATLGNERFDLRVVTIGGRVTHQVARLSHGPMTNLNLGNRRLQMAEVYQQLPWYQKEVEPVVRTACVSVAKAFPGMTTLGIDVLVKPDRSISILEVNAFGGLLPGTEHHGKSTYDWEVDHLLEQWQMKQALPLGASRP